MVFPAGHNNNTQEHQFHFTEQQLQDGDTRVQEKIKEGSSSDFFCLYSHNEVEIINKKSFQGYFHRLYAFFMKFIGKESYLASDLKIKGMISSIKLLRQANKNSTQFKNLESYLIDIQDHRRKYRERQKSLDRENHQENVQNSTDQNNYHLVGASSEEEVEPDETDDSSMEEHLQDSEPQNDGLHQNNYDLVGTSSEEEEPDANGSSMQEHLQDNEPQNEKRAPILPPNYNSNNLNIKETTNENRTKSIKSENSEGQDEIDITPKSLIDKKLKFRSLIEEAKKSPKKLVQVFLFLTKIFNEDATSITEATQNGLLSILDSLKKSKDLKNEDINEKIFSEGALFVNSQNTPSRIYSVIPKDKERCSFSFFGFLSPDDHTLYSYVIDDIDINRFINTGFFALLKLAESKTEDHRIDFEKRGTRKINQGDFIINWLLPTLALGNKVKKNKLDNISPSLDQCEKLIWALISEKFDHNSSHAALNYMHIFIRMHEIEKLEEAKKEYKLSLIEGNKNSHLFLGRKAIAGLENHNTTEQIKTIVHQPSNSRKETNQNQKESFFEVLEKSFYSIEKARLKILIRTYQDGKNYDTAEQAKIILYQLYDDRREINKKQKESSFELTLDPMPCKKFIYYGSCHTSPSGSFPDEEQFEEAKGSLNYYLSPATFLFNGIKNLYKEEISQEYITTNNLVWNQLKSSPFQSRYSNETCPKKGYFYFKKNKIKGYVTFQQYSGGLSDSIWLYFPDDIKWVEMLPQNRELLGEKLSSFYFCCSDRNSDNRIYFCNKITGMIDLYAEKSSADYDWKIRGYSANNSDSLYLSSFKGSLEENPFALKLSQFEDLEWIFFLGDEKKRAKKIWLPRYGLKLQNSAEGEWKIYESENSEINGYTLSKGQTLHHFASFMPFLLLEKTGENGNQKIALFSTLCEESYKTALSETPYKSGENPFDFSKIREKDRSISYVIIQIHENNSSITFTPNNEEGESLFLKICEDNFYQIYEEYNNHTDLTIEYRGADNSLPHNSLASKNRASYNSISQKEICVSIKKQNGSHTTLVPFAYIPPDKVHIQKEIVEYIKNDADEERTTLEDTNWEENSDVRADPGNFREDVYENARKNKKYPFNVEPVIYTSIGVSTPKEQLGLGAFERYLIREAQTCDVSNPSFEEIQNLLLFYKLAFFSNNQNISDADNKSIKDFGEHALSIIFSNRKNLEAFK